MGLSIEPLRPRPARGGLFRPGKYLEVARITLRSQFAYIWDTVVGLAFMLVIMFIFGNLWRATYQGQDAVSGYTLRQVLWYLVFTETLVLSAPQLHTRVDAEVKSGDVAYRLSKPFHFLGFHYAGFLAEAAVRAVLCLLLGGAVAWLMVGPPPVPAPAVLPVALAYAMSQSVQFCLAAGVGLLAFWIEDTAGVMLLVDRVKWILGGLLIPMELLPEGLARFARWLPFQDLLYGPARLFVAFDAGAFGTLALRLLLWGGLGLAGVLLLYHLGTRRLEVNGG